MLTVWYWEFYMLPFSLALLLVWNYLRMGSGRAAHDLVSPLRSDLLLLLPPSSLQLGCTEQFH